MDRILRATVNSWNGLVAAARSEAAFRQELMVLPIAVLLAFVLAADAWRWAALVGVVLLVMTVELLNTAIEKLADRVTQEIDPAIRIVKDIGSAAVGIALAIAGLVWGVALGEWLGWW